MSAQSMYLLKTMTDRYRAPKRTGRMKTGYKPSLLPGKSKSPDEVAGGSCAEMMSVGRRVSQPKSRRAVLDTLLLRMWR